VPFDDLYAGLAQARDDLGVSRVVALVGPEVEDAQGSLGEDLFDLSALALTGADALFVVTRHHLAQ
jgi:hypothetical protein